MPYSHHSHSGSFCRHAKGTLEEGVEEAIKQDFKVFCLSEHAPRYRQQDLYPEESDLTPSDLSTIFTSYLNEAHRLRSLHSHQISLAIGIETDLISPLDLAGLTTLLEQEHDRIDFVVGSLHHVNEIAIDFDRETFEKALASFAPSSSPPSSSSSPTPSSMTLLLHSYFDNQFTLLQRIQPEVIGHFDLVRLWNPELRFTDHEGVWEKVERNVRFAVGYGGMFEVNAAAFRKGWKEAYPGWDVLELIISLGGRLCLSDDSHGPQAVGLNYHLLRTYLLEHNVQELWYLLLDLSSSPSPPPSTFTSTTTSPSSDSSKSSPPPPKRSGRATPKRVEGIWSEDPFWSSRS